MKSNNILSYLLILFMILGVSSCKDDEPTNTNNNSNKSGAILTLEYNGQTETYILDYLYLQSPRCINFETDVFEFPLLVCGQEAESFDDPIAFASLDFSMHESNYPISTGNYKTEYNGCVELAGNDKDVCYAEMSAWGGFFGFNDVGIQFISDEGDFNISTISSNKISFEYEGKLLIYDGLTEDVLGTINVTCTADNISYDDEY